MTRFPFRFDPLWRPALLAVGAITPSRAWVDVTDEHLEARFGVWHLSTPRSNVAGAEVTGPHNPLRAIGVRYSFTDSGLTFGSSARRMTCIRFVEPVRIDPVDLTGHPGLSVSVEDPDGLAELLNG